MYLYLSRVCKNYMLLLLDASNPHISSVHFPQLFYPLLSLAALPIQDHNLYFLFVFVLYVDLRLRSNMKDKLVDCNSRSEEGLCLHLKSVGEHLLQQGRTLVRSRRVCECRDNFPKQWDSQSRSQSRPVYHFHSIRRWWSRMYHELRWAGWGSCTCVVCACERRTRRVSQLLGIR